MPHFESLGIFTSSMKPIKSMSIPQKEFGFAKDVFNLFHEWTSDGEHLERERAEAEAEATAAHQRAQAAQASLFPIKE